MGCALARCPNAGTDNQFFVCHYNPGSPYHPYPSSKTCETRKGLFEGEFPRAPPLQPAKIRLPGL